MGNKFRNEMEIKLGETKILLRPTFENIAATETNVGPIAYLGWKISRARAESEKKNASLDKALRSVMPLTEIALIIYYNQAATDPNDSTQKKFSREEIWDLVCIEGMGVSKPIIQFIARMVAGGKEIDDETLNDVKKKSKSTRLARMISYVGKSLSRAAKST